MAKREKVREMGEDRAIAIALGFTSCFLLVALLITLNMIDDLRNEMYCGSKDINRIVVYNESVAYSASYPIGDKCCPKKPTATFNDTTGEWRAKWEECVYHPR